MGVLGNGGKSRFFPLLGGYLYGVRSVSVSHANLSLGIADLNLFATSGLPFWCFLCVSNFLFFYRRSQRTLCLLLWLSFGDLYDSDKVLLYCLCCNICVPGVVSFWSLLLIPVNVESEVAFAVVPAINCIYTSFRIYGSSCCIVNEMLIGQ